ncbi:hypothetical protein BC833DRAFT_565869 [Globomyces pollinis-pini]|nr:hypothetical protein BC833DRAFT_565869 [Globomyces pollinis-pini]
MSLVFQAAWKDTNCIGPPTTMQFFNESNPTQIFYDISEFILPPICGVGPIPMDNGCCVSSLDLSLSDDYLAYSHHYFEGDFQIQLPKTALKHSYCQIQYTNESLLYPNYFLASGTCIDSMFTCTSDGTLKIYEEDNCTIESEVFQLTNELVELNSTTFGNVFVQLIQIGSGEVLYDIHWVGYYPGTLFTPLFKAPLEVLGLISMILSFIISIFFIFKYGKEYKEKRKWIALNSMAIQICWLIYEVFYTCYWCIIYQEEFQYLVVAQMYGMFENFATFLTAYETVMTILYFFHIKTPVIVWSSSEVEKSFLTWVHLAPVWRLLLHVMNAFPPLYMVFRYSQTLCSRIKRPVLECCWIILSTNYLLGFALLLQLLNFALYIVTNYLSTYTQILYDDRNLLANSCFIVLCEVMHSVINSIVMQQLRTVLKTFNNTVTSFAQRADHKPGLSVNKH